MAHRRRTPRDRERDAKRASTTARGYGSAWQKARKLAILRDGKACRVCGSSGLLDAHHLDRDKTNNDLDNLLTLCRACHRRLHSENK